MCHVYKMFLHSFPLLILPVALLLSGENGFGEIVALPQTPCPVSWAFSPVPGEIRHERQEQGHSLCALSSRPASDPISCHLQKRGGSSRPPTTLSKEPGFGDGKAAAGILIYSRKYHTKPPWAPREGMSYKGLSMHLLDPLLWEELHFHSWHRPSLVRVLKDHHAINFLYISLC